MAEGEFRCRDGGAFSAFKVGSQSNMTLRAVRCKGLYGRKTASGPRTLSSQCTKRLVAI
eukprot:COSAG01_NODE_4718_length_4794_cov_363.209585_6_plen_59_part_00